MSSSCVRVGVLLYMYMNIFYASNNNDIDVREPWRLAEGWGWGLGSPQAPIQLKRSNQNFNMMDIIQGYISRWFNVIMKNEGKFIFGTAHQGIIFFIWKF